jgi:hypothetical protein
MEDWEMLRTIGWLAFAGQGVALLAISASHAKKG